jgi:hypothetical protein
LLAIAVAISWRLPGSGALCSPWLVSPGWNSWGSTWAPWWPGPVPPLILCGWHNSYPGIHFPPSMPWCMPPPSGSWRFCLSPKRRDRYD